MMPVSRILGYKLAGKNICRRQSSMFSWFSQDSQEFLEAIKSQKALNNYERFRAAKGQEWSLGPGECNLAG